MGEDWVNLDTDNTEYQILALSLLIWLAGLSIGIEKNGEHFARSGAIIVTIGILFGLLNMPGKLAKLENEYEESHKAETKRLVEMYRTSVGLGSALINDLTKSHSTLRTRLRNKLKRIMFVEAFVLSLGTLTWGFGDLIDHLI